MYKALLFSMIVFILSCSSTPPNKNQENYIEADYSVVDDAKYSRVKFLDETVYVAEKNKVSDDLYFVNVGVKDRKGSLIEPSQEDGLLLNKLFNDVATDYCEGRSYKVKPSIVKRVRPAAIAYTSDVYYYKLGTIVCQ